MQTKGEGVKKVETLADVINGCSLIELRRHNAYASINPFGEMRNTADSASFARQSD